MLCLRTRKGSSRARGRANLGPKGHGWPIPSMILGRFRDAVLSLLEPLESVAFWEGRRRMWPFVAKAWCFRYAADWKTIWKTQVAAQVCCRNCSIFFLKSIRILQQALGYHGYHGISRPGQLGIVEEMHQAGWNLPSPSHIIARMDHVRISLFKGCRPCRRPRNQTSGTAVCVLALMGIAS